MSLFKKKRLAIASTVYWFLLVYSITDLGWWFIALEKTNHRITGYRLQQLKPDQPDYAAQRTAILTEEKRQTFGYIGEGSTFLFLILLGAIYVYREVRRQIRFQQQQQNFMMAVTHELKTPIAVTKLNLETLRKYRLDEDKQQRVIQATIQETDRLDSLANNILVASQLEGGDYVRTKEILDLSQLAEQSVRDYRHRFPEREWIDHIRPGCTIAGDPFLIHLLINNLLDNALKYSPKEGAVTLTLTKEGAHTLLAIKDNGPGIPDEEKKKIFRKFYRTGRETTRQTKGTGLGLYLCRKIAADHKASIKVADNSPTGSIFTVVF
ncbi:MAG TPA: HAMP domain-containing sensor histidine kinase [Puia sp.]|nr:HAMP domain-containing sensor histidine kinase [Puia sp.]